MGLDWRKQNGRVREQAQKSSQRGRVVEAAAFRLLQLVGAELTVMRRKRTTTSMRTIVTLGRLGSFTEHNVRWRNVNQFVPTLDIVMVMLRIVGISINTSRSRLRPVVKSPTSVNWCKVL